jgi:ribonuclease R
MPERIPRDTNLTIDFRTIAQKTMLNYGFLANFPPRLMQEVHSFQHDQMLKQNKDELKDLRGLLWVSIDNHESLDLDQIEYCERAKNQEIHVMVAIADVDCYVTKGSLTDRHAYHNGSSVYMGLRNYPMLPDELSTDLTSLKEDEDRAAVVIDYFVKKDGSIRFNDIYRALVCNKAKLVYESVGEWLEQSRTLLSKFSQVAGLGEQVLLQDEAAQRLHNLRMKKGALEFETIEPRVVALDDQIVDLAVRQKNRAHYIIENFMIAANQTMSWFLDRKGYPSIQRILNVPNRWDRIVMVAHSCGDDLPDQPDAQALSDFLARRRNRDPERFPDLSLTIVKLLGQAEYRMSEPGKEKIGHFGLAVQDYIHSTAPNRRYVDLIIQRLLKASLNKENCPYTKKELSDIAYWCTTKSHEAKKVERFMRKVAAMILLKDSIGEIFDGIVTGASEKGTYVRLFKPPAEGRILRGEFGLNVGQKVKVRLIHLDPENGYIDFERAGTQNSGKVSKSYAKIIKSPPKRRQT